MLERLSECLVVEILSLLPIKSVLQLKSVNKFCYNIIKSPYFISKHLKHNNGRHNNCIIAQFVVTPGGDLETRMAWLNDEIDEDNTIDNYMTLHNYCMCGPCDGLYYACCPRFRVGKRFLWNRALKQVKTLPPIIRKTCMPSNIEYFNENCGFGFDPVTVDYKVVVIKGYRDSTDELLCPRSFWNYPQSVILYSLRNDSWNYLGDLSKSYYLCRNSSYTFLNTSFYWLGSDDFYPFRYNIVIVVNLATEAIEEIRIPKTRIKGSITQQTYAECLMVYHSTIALITLYKDDGCFDIWTLNERSWSKQLSVKLDSCVRNLLGYYCLHENMVLFGGMNGELVLYYLDLNESRALPVNSHGYCRIVSTHMESLVPLNDQQFWLQWEKHRVNIAII
ncbi:hypothetical protein RND81_11G048500 [Saponaria officinalis]|uniref:F-box domain-containing protein n=1 Tax=Saponaria officinalis TaxID=3572 RepID=A0AAW1HJL5_SAPOF